MLLWQDPVRLNAKRLAHKTSTLMVKGMEHRSELFTGVRGSKSEITVHVY